VIPIKDLNPTSRPAVVTLVLIALCTLVYFGLQQPAGSRLVQTDAGRVQIDAKFGFTLERAAIPCEVVTGRPLGLTEIRQTFVVGDQDACIRSARQSGPELYPHKQVYLALLVSMFLHGGIIHLFGNMLFLWVFGNNVEDRLGHLGYIVFYVTGGLVASLAHVAAEPSSTVPVVGASGAIAAVMGAYLVWFPRTPVLTFIPPFFILPIRAWWFLVFWFGFQFLTDPNSGVAWVAHVAGFLFGALVGLAVRSAGHHDPPRGTGVPGRGGGPDAGEAGPRHAGPEHAPQPGSWDPNGRWGWNRLAGEARVEAARVKAARLKPAQHLRSDSGAWAGRSCAR
jgi:rhomboid family protein